MSNTWLSFSKTRWQQNSCLTVFRLFGLCGDVGDDAAQQGHWKGIQDLSLAMLERHAVTNVAINRYCPPPVTSCHYRTPLPGASKLSVSGLVGAPNKCTALAALNLSEMSKCFLLADFHIFDFSCNLSTQRHIGRSSPSTATHNAQLSELFCQIEVFERPEGSCTDVDR